MKILSVNNFQMQNQKRQSINFGVARFKFKDSSTAKYVNDYILPLACINDAVKRTGTASAIELVEKGEASFYTTLSENEKIISGVLKLKDLLENTPMITQKMIDDMLENYKYKGLAGKKAVAELDFIRAKRSNKAKKAQISEKRVAFQEAEKNFEQIKKEIIRKLEELIAPKAVESDDLKFREMQAKRLLPGVSESA